MAEEHATQPDLPSIRFTEPAKAKLSEVVAGQPRPVSGLRLQIVDRTGGEFQHVLSVIEQGAETAEDLVVEADGFRVFVPPNDAPYLNGVTVNYEFKGPNVSGLEYDNPNPVWRDEREVQIQQLFDNEINPAIAAHGGWVSLIGVEGTTAYVELGGGCQGCGMADVTLKQGIAAAILETIEGIENVVDKTDHASGTNPYYQPSKK